MEAGTPLLSIPLEMIIGLESAKTARTAIMAEFNPDLAPVIVLALHILEEKVLGTQSKWHAFFNHLPKTLPGTLFLSKADLESTTGSHIHSITENRLQTVLKFYQAIKEPVTSKAVDPPLFTKDEFTYENFKWALGVVW